jgi:uncharacterized protein HemY
MSEKTASALAEEISRLVEKDQGMGFVSDGLGAAETPEAVFQAVRFHFIHADRAAKIMRAWLKKHGEESWLKGERSP